MMITSKTGRFPQWRVLCSELNRVNWIALPMIIVTVSQYLVRASPIFMLGHLDELSLSSASIAISLCNVTGFSVVLGMSSALETLCGQANGAEQYKRVGTYTYAAILCLFLACLPLSLLFFLTEKILLLVHQDPLISAEAGKFAIRLIPTLFPYAILQCVIRYLQAQSLVIPILWSSLASLCLQLPLCWAFIFKLNLGSSGAALSIGISYWFNVILIVLYMKYSPTCNETRSSFSKDVFVVMWEFFRLAIPSAVMVCLEWWAFELVVLLSGLMSNPKLETSVLSICVTIGSLNYLVAYSFGCAASTLVSNALGAGKSDSASVVLYAVLIMSVLETLLVSITIYICRGVLGYAFSAENEIVHYVKELAPFVSLSIIVDTINASLSGVARGSGWQRVGAFVNLGAYYLFGIPVALLLGFLLHLKGKGLWIGMVVGATVQLLLLSLITGLTNWEKQAREARQRIFGGEIPVEDQPI